MPKTLSRERLGCVAKLASIKRVQTDLKGRIEKSVKKRAYCLFEGISQDCED